MGPGQNKRNIDLPISHMGKARIKRWLMLKTFQNDRELYLHIFKLFCDDRQEAGSWRLGLH